MPSLEKPSQWFSDWFKIGILGLWLLSLVLRFWGLGRFNTLVFDEVYYVKFAHNYLSQTQFFDGHPPLSKYLIAIGIWIGNHLPFGWDAVNHKAGADYTTWSYRWLNALTGSFIPLVVLGLAYQLTHRRSYAFIAGLLMAFDGLFLVESRYALNNVYLVILGLLGLWLLLIALNTPRSRQREAWLVLSGICFGASASIKWNGLWFLLGAYGIWVSAWVIRLVQFKRPGPIALFPTEITTADQAQTATARNPLQRLTQLKLWQVVLYLGVIPAAFYRLIWIPHLQLNPNASFWTLQKQILTYHEKVGDGPKIHPYCSHWYTWLWMIRPVAYFYQVTPRDAPLPDGSSNLTTATPNTVIYDVHATGNPMLWWLSTIAIILLLGVLIYSIVNWATAETEASQSPPLQQKRISPLNPTERWLGLFLVVNYGANLLPWVRVTRCTFLYHYMGSSVFATMALAWLVDRWLRSSQPRLRIMGIAIVLLIAIAFIFWLPIYLGLPLSPFEFSLRMWLRSWV
ncbi:phospholipid carrier-dependent glycosyltransferase [Kovacikia minuta CCNUW1]|uniref:dolichyl-phosphate-mannose--protein mannosyltransferase n=1 Tax=Kovacikia minuta TaxID=2931930 RepID=UPI001CCC57EE|nr:phospholipid carrier-dependent glycosyltransferase [Kovacikia minuta]UBF26760.1 phospholipid carrier-dependent glycosyltransferase [Kovacikia minuta CCNUW1]